MQKNHLKPKLFGTFELVQWLIFINFMPEGAVKKINKTFKNNPRANSLHGGLNNYVVEGSMQGF